MAAIIFPPNPAGQTPVNTFSTTSTPLANTANSFTYTWNGTAWTSASSGGGGGGTVTGVTGTLPITVATGTTTPVIAINAATTAAAGSAQLADSAAITAGTTGRVVDAAQLKATGQVIEVGAIYIIWQGPSSGTKICQQWGISSDPTPGNTIATFTKTYSSAPYVTTSPISTDGTYVFVSRVTSSTTTSVTLARAAMPVSGGVWSTTAVSVYWTAIGPVA